MRRLLQVVGISDIESFRKWHTLTITGIMERERLNSEDYWSRAFAVGDEEWLEIQLQNQGLRE